MQVLVFKTNINDMERLRHVRPMFVNHPKVKEWSVDLEDCDHVLRVVAKPSLQEGSIIYLINACGYYCETLTD